MNRRKFLYTTGAVVTTATMNTFLPSIKEGISKRQLPNEFEQPVLKGIAYGLNAPNPHNTQAWKFKLLSDTEMLFFVDETRLLQSTDPTTRQIHIGCGCFIACCRLGMQLAGYQTVVDYFPVDQANYSTTEIGKQAIAKIQFIKKKGMQVDSLANHIFDRCTSRLQYKQVDIEDDDFLEILTLAAPKHTQVQLVNNASRLHEILPILAGGMEVETFTYQTHEESRKWFRENDDRIAAERDGINLRGSGVKGLKKWIAEKQLKGLSEEKWHAKKMNDYSLKSHAKKVLSSKGIVTIKTSQNDFIDWIKAGEDYLRFQLAAFKFDYYLHPLSQVLQEFEEMKELRLQFENAMGIKNNEKIQMAVRIGKSNKPYQSYRRAVKDIVV